MKLDRLIDSLALVCVGIVLSVAFYFQLVRGELPCSLCNLQRIGFMLFGAGLFLNAWHGSSRTNYLLSALGALAGSLVGLLQMFLHVLPGTPPYGDAVLGMHMYAATYVALTAGVVYCVAMLAFQARLSSISVGSRGVDVRRPLLASAACIFFAALVFGNLVSVVLEVGFNPLASEPQHYELLCHESQQAPASPGACGR